MSNNCTPNDPLPRARASTPKLQGKFAWTEARKLALELVFADEISDEEIARRCGVCRRTLAYWKTNTVFIAALDATIERYRVQSLALAVEAALRRFR